MASSRSRSRARDFAASATAPGGVPLQPGPPVPPRTAAAGLTLVGSRASSGAPAGPSVAVPSGVPVLWSWNAADGRLTLTRRVRAMLGLPPGARPGLVAVRRLVHVDDRERFDDLVLRLATGRAPVQGTVRVVTPAGQVRELHAWAGVRADGDRVAGVFGGLVDVTVPEVGALQGALTALHAVEELTGVGLWEWDPASGELLWTAPMYALVGAVPGSLLPTLARWREAVHPHDRERAARLDAGALERTGGHVETLRLLGDDGVLRYVTCWSAAVPGPDGVRVHGAALEVSRQVRDEARLERLSATDAVTGLMNRHGLVRQLRHQLTAAASGGGAPRDDVALLLLDLDRFQAVNDTLGHHVGDALLVEVSRRLAGVVPEGTVTARMGGDEFAVVPRPGIGGDQLRRLAETVVAALRMPYLLPAPFGTLTCPASVGVSSGGGRAVGAQELLAEADLALYEAKGSGRGRYVVFDDTLRTRARARHQAERLLRSALDSRRLVLRYQPVVDLATGRQVGSEALVRIRPAEGSREGALLLPDTFIDVAEDTGLIVELDDWVVDHALDVLARQVHARGVDAVPWLAVNVSPRSMAEAGVVRRLVDGLAARRIPPRLLKVELTERSFLAADPALRELIASGVPVGIDDFGTGYSALAYLQRFDLDFMKIDRSFVAAVGEQGRADAVVTAIVDLAHAHGMRVTAEGIEHARQAGRLREIGCDLAQGYHFGRPGPAPEPR